MIDIRDLNVVFGHGRKLFHAVRDLSLEVEAGQSYGLVGESGSGKTTVLRALAGLLQRVARVSGEVMRSNSAPACCRQRKSMESAVQRSESARSRSRPVISMLPEQPSPQWAASVTDSVGADSTSKSMESAAP